MSYNEFDGLFGVAEIDLIYQSQPDLNERPQVRCAEEAQAIFSQAWDKNKIDLLEESKVILLNRANKVLGIYNNSSGGITATVMDIRLIFAAALKSNATSIVLGHNHPSGNLTPSTADKAITEKFFEAGRLLDIQVLDHIIISRHSYYSLAEGRETKLNGITPQL